jgi:membrane fusion protein (multidrug efflux system)
MFKRLALMLIAVALVVGGIAAVKMRQIAAMKAMFSAAPPAVAVVPTQVTAERWPRALAAVGSFAPVQGVDVTTEVAGQVSALHFESGQRVTKGEVLLSLDTSVDEAELAGLVAEQKLMQLQFERAARLLKEKTVAQQQYDDAAAKRDEAAALVEAKRAHLAKKTIRAPFTGVLGIRKVDVGQYLKEGAAIVPLQTLDPIYVDYALPERHFGTLKLGQEVAVTVQAYGGERFSGRITAFDPGLDPGTRNIRIRATLPNPDERLRPGMFADVSTLEGADADVLTVPTTAVTYTPYGNSVFVIKDEGGKLTVTRQQITTGETRAGRVAVTQGLAAGDRLVAVGHNKLRNGMSVKLATPAPAANATAGNAP